MENVAPYPSLEETKTAGTTTEVTHVKSSTHKNLSSSSTTESTFYGRFHLDEMYG